MRPLPPLAAILTASTMVTLAHADAPHSPAQPPAPSMPTPTPDDACRVLRWVESWMKSGTTPDIDQQPRLNLSDVIGVTVTLRLGGVAIGRAQVLRPDLSEFLDGKTPRASDVGILATQAAAMAIQKARQRLDETTNSKNNAVSVTAPFLCAEVELAHSPRPVVLPTLDQGGSLVQQYAHHHEGMILRQTGPCSVLFPGEASSKNLSYDMCLDRLCADLHLGPSESKLIGRPDGARCWVFQSEHWVRADTKMEPTALIRGTPLVPTAAANMTGIASAAQVVAVHLINKVNPNQDKIVQIKGGYRPETDTYQPAEGAPPSEAALCAYALVRFSAMRLATNPDDVPGDRALRSANALLAPLLVICTDPKQDPQPIALGFALMALTESPSPPDKQWRDRLAAELMALSKPEGFLSSNRPNAQPASPATQAILLAALASWYARTRDPGAQHILEDYLTRIGGRLNAEMSADILYWLLVAEQRCGDALAKATADPAAATAAHQARLQTLATQLLLLRSKQICAIRRGMTDDVLGGFNANPDPVTQPIVTWQSAYATAAWGRLLTSRTLGDKENLDELSLANRFLMQLTLSPSGAYASKNNKCAIGGVKSAPWDTQLNNLPTAMTLLAYIETLEGCAAVVQRPPAR